MEFSVIRESEDGGMPWWARCSWLPNHTAPQKSAIGAAMDTMTATLEARFKCPCLSINIYEDLQVLLSAFSSSDFHGVLY